MLNGLSLFSGIGGIDVALSEWVRPIAYCEIDPYCQGVLLSRMVCGLLPEAPIWDDIKTLQIQSPDNSIDILYGGFPCQDISVAGLGKGLAGERSGLFFEIVRLAKEIKPKFIFLENVGAIRSRGGIEVLRSIAELGYDTRFCVISAASVGAPHKRERWFMLAYAKHYGSSSSKIHRSPKESVSNASQGADNTIQSERMDHTGNVADTESLGMQKSGDQIRIEKGQPKPMVSSLRTYWEETECPICGVDDVVSYRLDRIKSLGNAVVIPQAKKAFQILMGLEK